MKRLFLFLFVASFMMACTGGQKSETNQGETTEQAIEVTVGNFKEKAVDLVGKTILIKGTADHICRGDGRKLFLIDVEMPGRVRVVPNEDMAAFNTEQEGLDFVVTGVVAETYIDEEYLLEWEEELKAETGSENALDCESEEPGNKDGEEGEEHEHHSADAAYEQIANYRKMMAEQGVEKLSFYHIVAVSYEVIKE
ncbi:MAG: hypothetical protein KG029_04250 [Bacteroidetes bacterium]|jgi:hypothetical protein|nr:hypothetical protein [Bacteroidota bacterium]